MKGASLLLAAVLLLAVLMPSVVLFDEAGKRCEVAITELDVCHSAAPAISAGGEMLFIHEHPAMPVPEFTPVANKRTTRHYPRYLLAAQNEHPPES